MAWRAGRYPSDTSDEQWALIEPLLPPVNTGGRPEKHPRRAIVDAILYVVRGGCSWRQLPADFPPWQTVGLAAVLGRRGRPHRGPARRGGLDDHPRGHPGRSPRPLIGLGAGPTAGSDTLHRP